MLTVLAFVRPPRFRNPARVESIYTEATGRTADAAAYWRRRSGLNRAYAFGLLPGATRARQAFGGRIPVIEWEYTTRDLDADAPPDPRHMLAAVEHYNPAAVLAFGPEAAAGLLDVVSRFAAAGRERPFWTIAGPAFDAAKAGPQLDAMAAKLDEIATGGKGRA